MRHPSLAFLLMCAIWGTTWIAIKTGVDAVPPISFAALRFAAAGTVLALLSHRRGNPRWPRTQPLRAIAAALAINTACYGLLFWGMQHVSSSLSAVINLSLIPVGLFGIGVLAGEEVFVWRRLLAIVIGVIGLGVLFQPQIQPEMADGATSGKAALVLGTLAYCGGSILSRPLLREFDPIAVSSWHNLIGACGLGVVALVLEPADAASVSALLQPPVLASWLFLVVGGSVVAFTIYLGLLRDVGPSVAGLYAFISPIVAIALGVAVFDEPFGQPELTGSLLLLGAAALATPRRYNA